MGQTAREKTAPPQTRVQEVASEQPGVRIFVVHSDERLAYERTQRLHQTPPPDGRSRSEELMVRHTALPSRR